MTIKTVVLQACLKHKYRIGALLACWAVLFRQTNAVWVCFIIGVGASTAPSGIQVVVACNARFNTGAGKLLVPLAYKMLLGVLHRWDMQT